MGHKGAGDPASGSNPIRMDLRRYVAAVDRFVGGLVPVDEADRAAGFEIALASRRFSRRTQAVVDDKLSFSATLMRAGEVEAANRLLAEVEDEVLTEEAALLEKVNEVKVARAIDRPPVSRLRLARALAVAVLGSSLLASSAVGMAVAGLFRDRDGNTFESAGDARERRALVARLERGSVGAMKRIKVAGVPMRLTRAEMREFDELTSGSIDEARLQSFLLSVLPAPLAEKVHSALVVASQTISDSIEEPIAELTRKVAAEKRKGDSTEKEDSAQEPGDEQPPPDDEPSPTPSDGSKDDDGEKPDDGGDSPTGDVPLIGGD